MLVTGLAESSSDLQQSVRWGESDRAGPPSCPWVLGWVLHVYGCPHSLGSGREEVMIFTPQNVCNWEFYHSPDIYYPRISSKCRKCFVADSLG